jgi:hypothetical protein
MLIIPTPALTRVAIEISSDDVENCDYCYSGRSGFRATLQDIAPPDVHSLLNSLQHLSQFYDDASPKNAIWKDNVIVV